MVNATRSKVNQKPDATDLRWGRKFYGHTILKGFRAFSLDDFLKFWYVRKMKVYPNTQKKKKKKQERWHGWIECAVCSSQDHTGNALISNWWKNKEYKQGKINGFIKISSNARCSKRTLSTKKVNFSNTFSITFKHFRKSRDQKTSLWRSKKRMCAWLLLKDYGSTSWLRFTTPTYPSLRGIILPNKKFLASVPLSMISN